MPVVYILTNPAMPNILKIGCTERTIEDRMRELSGASGVPLPFECFMAVELQPEHVAAFEKALHDAFSDKRVNPKREFFELSPDRPAAILRFVERITTSKNVTPHSDIVSGPEELEALDRERKRRSNFRFSLAGIKPGAILTSTFDDTQTAEVIDDRQVRFRGQDVSLTKAALAIAHETGRNWSTLAGPQFWNYDGKSLTEIRNEIEDTLS